MTLRSHSRIKFQTQRFKKMIAYLVLISCIMKITCDDITGNNFIMPQNNKIAPSNTVIVLQPKPNATYNMNIPSAKNHNQKEFLRRDQGIYEKSTNTHLQRPILPKKMAANLPKRGVKFNTNVSIKGPIETSSSVLGIENEHLQLVEVPENVNMKPLMATPGLSTGSVVPADTLLEAQETYQESPGKSEPGHTQHDVPSTNNPYNPNSSVSTTQQNIQVLFYDPHQLSENNIPQHVYDESGNIVDISGQKIVFLPSETSLDVTKYNTTESASTNNSSYGVHQDDPKLTSIKTQLSLKSSNKPKDNMIVIGTVLTMAVFVGALTGKRIRKSCNFLQYFIESEGIEDEDNSDVNELLRSTSTMGSTAAFEGMSYDTFGKYGGDLRWRGDLEKFDV